MPKLNFKKLESLTGKTKICDGNGLWIYVSSKTSKSWVFIWQKNKKKHEIGLGSYPAIPLSKARELAFKAKQLVNEGKNPKDELRRNTSHITFEEVSTNRFDSIKHTFKNHTHRDQWLSSLKLHVFPHIGKKNISDISADDIFDVLRRIWDTKQETARKIKQRIFDILEWSIFEKHRKEIIHPKTIEARLKTLKVKINQPIHFPAADYTDLPDKFAKLHQTKSVSSLALQLLILTASRTIEIRKADWSQFDTCNHKWIKPASIMKMNQEHEVSLSAFCNGILEEARKFNSLNDTTLIFQGVSKISERDIENKKDIVLTNVISENTMSKTAKQIFGNQITVHGFRSTFRDWARENNIKDDVAELCLAHRNSNAVERAYKRTDLKKERKECLDKWSNFCTSKISTNIDNT